MARLLIYPKQQRYNVRYEKNWIFIEANQFFYYFYLSFHNQRGAPLRPAAAHVETENTGQADAERKPYRKKHRKCEIITWTNFPSYFTKMLVNTASISLGPLFVSSDEKIDDASVAQSFVRYRLNRIRWHAVAHAFDTHAATQRLPFSSYRNIFRRNMYIKQIMRNIANILFSDTHRQSIPREHCQTEEMETRATLSRSRSHQNANAIERAWLSFLISSVWQCSRGNTVRCVSAKTRDICYIPSLFALYTYCV